MNDKTFDITSMVQPGSSSFFSPTHTAKPNDLIVGLILGLGIGIPLLIVAAVFIGVGIWNCRRRQGYQNLPAAPNQAPTNNSSADQELEVAVDLDPYQVTGENEQTAIALPYMRR